ncbi:hypothetical protein [Paracoccus sp. (in: a-proteobacteria)]|uniref:hypothetical protein n=1 Tax=Paracoccus sp. TaxID=267 RepID=UPI0026DEA5C1|nr:hypothetical protein [Paracoccus sp. (in: a-proteobacteria)]MDO5648840.1 hypothetical protein [Paracoccus sp. (in: a-proteobacteria)]
MTGKAGRRPADAPTPGRQDIWEAIRAAKPGFSAGDLAEVSGANRKTVEDYLRCLIPAGVIEHLPAGGFRLVDDRGVHAPRLNRQGQPVVQGAGVENMWRSMRMMAAFSSLDLAVHSSAGDVTVSESTAKSYCHMLLKTGFLRVEQKAVPGKRAAVYRLIRNTGPQPPQIQRIKRVYDPNTKQVHLPGGGA